MNEKEFRLKFGGLKREILEFIRLPTEFDLSDYGIEEDDIKLENLSLTLEVLKEIIKANNNFSPNWNTYGYIHRSRNRTLLEYLEFFEPFLKKIETTPKEVEIEKFIKTISEGEKVIIGGIDPKKHSIIMKNYQIIGTCHKWIYLTENLLRLFIEQIFIKEKSSILNPLYNSATDTKIKSRKVEEKKKLYIPIRGGHDIFYMDFIDLNGIIVNHWNIFKNYFDSQDWITQKIKELYEIRNRVAHNSMYLIDDTLELVKAYCKAIIKQVYPYIY